MKFKLLLSGADVKDEQNAKLNYFLVKVFNQILHIEEDALKADKFKKLSVREMHVIEAVSRASEQGHDNRSSDIAKELSISAGTLTTAVKLLEKKGYLVRKHDKNDKRIVRIYVTEKGKSANELHQNFHRTMISNVTAALSDEELRILVKGLEKLQAFFEKIK